MQRTIATNSSNRRSSSSSTNSRHPLCGGDLLVTDLQPDFEWFVVSARPFNQSRNSTTIDSLPKRSSNCLEEHQASEYNSRRRGMLFRNRYPPPFHPTSWIPQRLSLPFYCESSDAFLSFSLFSISLFIPSLADFYTCFNYRQFWRAAVSALCCLFHPPSPSFTAPPSTRLRVALSFAPRPRLAEVTHTRVDSSLSRSNQTICFQWPLRSLPDVWRSTAAS